MSNAPKGKWPSAQLLAGATYVDDAGPVRFVDTAAAARIPRLDAHSLECYRSLDTEPAFLQVRPLCPLRGGRSRRLGRKLPANAGSRSQSATPPIH